MTAYEDLLKRLSREPKTWLTGCAGLIDCNLLETLLRLNQRVIGVDNFATGLQRNLGEICGLVSPEQWARSSFHVVLHQSALGSARRFLTDPITTNSANIDGFLNSLMAARDEKVKSFTYAASSSTYGDHPALPKIEGSIRKPLSPSAITKYVNEPYRRRVRAPLRLHDHRAALFQCVRPPPEPDLRLRGRRSTSRNSAPMGPTCWRS